MVKSRVIFSLAVVGILRSTAAPSTGNKESFDGWYGGGSFGYAQLFGKRTESLARNGDSRSLSNKKHLHAQNLQGSLCIGYLTHLNNPEYVLGIEPYVGYAHLRSQRKSVSENVLQVSTLERKGYFGAALRAGILLTKSSLLYGLAGVEVSQFKYRNFDADNFTARARKSGTAVILGVGVEKMFKPFQLGFEVRYSHYQNIRFSPLDTDPQRPTFVKAKMQPRIVQAMVRLMMPFTSLKGE